MIDFNGWTTRIKQASLLLDILAKKNADKETQQQKSRRIPAFIRLDFNFADLDYTQRERVWFNGAEDVVIQGVSVSAGANRTSGSMRAVDAGFGETVFGALDDDNGLMLWDFGWNFRASRNGSYYLSPASNVSLLSSTVLRKRRRNNYHWFRQPQVCKAGDALTAIMKMRRFPYIQLEETPPTLSFVFFGFRNGVASAG